MKIDRIRLRNYHCFEKVDFSFSSRFNLIIGNNAKGKTTLLDALSVGLGSLFLGFPAPAESRNIASNEVRLGTFRHGDTWTVEPQFPTSVLCIGEVSGQTGKWRRSLMSETGRTTRKEAKWIQVESEQLGQAVKLGKEVLLPVVSYYGTGRLWLQLKQTKRKAEEIKTLSPATRFAGYMDCLNPASDVKRLQRWFKTKELSALQNGKPDNTLEACRKSILSCVPGATYVGFDVARDELMIRMEKDSLPFSLLSDGYRNMVAMVADIAIRCATLNPHLADRAAKETLGVVLIDEIDLHLHPRWQRQVVEDLLRTFPKVQFFATTHSPFVIQSLPPLADVRLLNLDDERAEDFRDKSVEDISEEIQGIELPQRSKRFLDMKAAAKEYFEILDAATRVPRNERAVLRAELDRLSMPFSDDPAFHALLEMKRAASGIDGEDN